MYIVIQEKRFFVKENKVQQAKNKSPQKPSGLISITRKILQKHVFVLFYNILISIPPHQSYLVSFANVKANYSL